MDEILKKFIEISPKSGFTESTVIESCILCEREYEICKFTNGVYSILDLIEEDINNELAKKFLLLNDDLKLSKKIKLALMLKLELYKELKNYSEFLREKLKFFTAIKRYRHGLEQLYKNVDFIWKLAEDRSSNFTFYTKRLTLAILYNKVIMKFINDNSPDLSETEIYIDKQLQKISNIAKVKNRIKNLFR